MMKFRSSIENKIAIEVVIGDRSRFSDSLIGAMVRAEQATVLVLALKLNILQIMVDVGISQIQRGVRRVCARTGSHVGGD